MNFIRETLQLAGLAIVAALILGGVLALFFGFIVNNTYGKGQ